MFASVIIIRKILKVGSVPTQTVAAKYQSPGPFFTFLAAPNRLSKSVLYFTVSIAYDAGIKIPCQYENCPVTNAKAHLTDLQHPWRRIRKTAGLADVRIHDLRHTFASGGLLVGEGLAMIGKLLGHTQVQTTARYAHLASDPVKQAAQFWEA